jgi:hypothetical protein
MAQWIQVVRQSDPARGCRTGSPALPRSELLLQRKSQWIKSALVLHGPDRKARCWRSHFPRETRPACSTVHRWRRSGLQSQSHAAAAAHAASRRWSRARPRSRSCGGDAGAAGRERGGEAAAGAGRGGGEGGAAVRLGRRGQPARAAAAAADAKDDTRLHAAAEITEGLRVRSGIVM